MSKRRKTQTQRRSRTWQPLERSVPYRTPEALAAAVAKLIELGFTEQDAQAAFDDRENAEQWMNDVYVVFVDRDPEGVVVRLSIRRQDRKPLRDWRDMQRIKNQLAGPEVEAVEVFPAQSRLVDTANQFWLWCLPPGERLPFGFEERFVTDDHEATPFGAVQRPFMDGDPLLDTMTVPPSRGHKANVVITDDPRSFDHCPSSPDGRHEYESLAAMCTYCRFDLSAVPAG